MIADLIAFARSEFELDKEIDGVSQREHLRRAWQMTGRCPAALADAPRLPEGCEAAWRAFTDMRASCPNGFSLARIPYGEIDAYLAPWEVRAVRAVDRVFIEVAR